MTDITTFEPDGRAIPYVDEGSGPAIVLVPGMGLNVRYLGPLAGALAEEDFRIVRIGSRHGATEGDLTMHDLAQDVVDVMDHLGLAGAWVGGHAFGGAIARTVSLDHAGRASGVLLLGVEAADTHESDLSELPPNARDAGVEAMQLAAREATPVEEWAGLAAGVPVLVVQGNDDTITPPANGEALQASAPDRVSVVGIAGGGHLFPATHIGETAWPIEDYLDWD
ncbi:alpha/beta fold hydrolase [Microbacterium thalassium]|uniref:Pimeloyl-ACP methyl ester carboxylesterase n=1 Tax=Microbacterium thalassium TaxID=362649 RepID=A0A7X0FSL8_9MICO|nr:alpha/beta hydrolase [Microbacterium thalassium]MBB6392362.1 pimeloyl-ACP methyl ester carboxylesterase [Microbacterium thalassium]GLK25105.1 alpha/beta hydrolase [Microbacterium thalassium]